MGVGGDLFICSTLCWDILSFGFGFGFGLYTITAGRKKTYEMHEMGIHLRYICLGNGHVRTQILDTHSACKVCVKLVCFYIYWTIYIVYCPIIKYETIYLTGGFDSPRKV